MLAMAANASVPIARFSRDDHGNDLVPSLGRPQPCTAFQTLANLPCGSIKKRHAIERCRQGREHAKAVDRGSNRTIPHARLYRPDPTDRHHHFALEARPERDLDPELVALHKRITERNAQILYRGTEVRSFNDPLAARQSA
jgi:hypothetical protein